MNKHIRQITATLLIIASALGLLFALSGLVGWWSYKARATKILEGQVGLLISVMDTTTQGLGVAEVALETTQSTIATLHSTVQTLAQSITDTIPLVNSISSILGDDLPQTILTTQTSLRAAQASAQIIDDVLKIVTAIPFFPGKPYNPQLPLHTALAEVSSSLDGMPTNFREMEQNLKQTNTTLGLVQENIAQIGGEVTRVNASVQQAQQIISQYKESSLALHHRLEQIQQKIAWMMNVISILLTLSLLWLAIAQLGLLSQGLDLLRRE